MSAEKVVTASEFWPVYFRLENNLLWSESSSFTSHLSHLSLEAASSVDIFSIENDISTIDFGTKDSSLDTVVEISYKETQKNVRS